MTTLRKPIGQTAERLLYYLRKELNSPKAVYDTSLTRIEGGFETSIFKFQLTGVTKEFSRPMILRLFPQYHNSEKAVWESAVQNALASSSYPAPCVYFTCTDKYILGGAFFIMEFIEGQNMLAAMFKTFPERLGELHAALHNIAPGPIIKILKEQGISEQMVRLDRRYDRINNVVRNGCPWLGEVAVWLRKNRPPEPERRSQCHGDFHPMNILVKDKEVSGVIDWPGFKIGDPVSDMAFTIALTGIHAAQIATQAEIENVIERYLASYLKIRPVSLENLPYYRVMRCANALCEAAEGQEYWRLPHAIKGTTEYIHEITGIRVTPEY